MLLKILTMLYYIDMCCFANIIDIYNFIEKLKANSYLR